MTRSRTMQVIERKLNEVYWGSVEIIVQDGLVTQITKKDIEKVREADKFESKDR